MGRRGAGCGLGPAPVGAVAARLSDPQNPVLRSMSYSAPVTRHMQQTNPIYGLACVYARPFFFKGDCFQTKVFQSQVKMVAGLLFCVVMTGRRRSGMGTRRGMQPFLWLRWVEVSPKRFSLPSLLTHSDRCTCPFGQMAKFA